MKADANAAKAMQPIAAEAFSQKKGVLSEFGIVAMAAFSVNSSKSFGYRKAAQDACLWNK